MKYSLVKADLLVPTADAATNVYTMDVVGSKADAAAAGAVTTTESLMAYSKQNVTNTEAAAVSLATALARSVPIITSGTTSYADAGGKQTIKELTIAKASEVYVTVDLVNMAQNGSVLVESKIDGTNYRVILSALITAIGNKAIGLGPFFANTDVRISYIEAVDEGADRDILYRTIQITRES